jgi:hypothetical protein
LKKYWNVLDAEGGINVPREMQRGHLKKVREEDVKSKTSA